MPVVPLGDLIKQAVVLTRVWLIVAGLYMWEFLTGLHYEWDVIRGRQPYRWTVWIYLIPRWAALGVVIIYLISSNATFPMRCKPWIWASWGLTFLSQGPATLLIVLRIFAIWDRNKVAVAIATIAWVINVSLQLKSVVEIRSVWEPLSSSCVITNIETTKASVVCMLVVDIVLLLIMLAGLLRLRRGGTYELWHLLWKQGVIWLAIATVTELPQTVLMILNIDEVLDMFFLFPSIVAMVIAATRIHRSLQYYASPTSSASYPDNLQMSRSSRLVSRTKDSSTVAPSDHLAVTVHTDTACDYPMSKMNHRGSYPDKPHEIDIDDDVEGREEIIGVPVAI